MNNTQILRQLFSAYANSQVTVELIAVYDRRLSTIPSEILQTVIDQCLDECKFLPTIAEIKERYRLLTVTPALDVADAWKMVTDQIQRPGMWGTPVFTDPLVAKIVSAMGWRELCLSENSMADRAHFQRMYTELVQRAEQDQKLTPESRQLQEGARPMLTMRKLLGGQ